MAKDVEIKFSKRQLEEVRKTLRSIPHEMPRVISQAINATAREGRTDISRKIRAVINAKVKDVNRRIVIKKATQKRWLAIIQIALDRLPLRTFGARQTKKGISYKIDRAGGREKIDSAFIATMPGGHIGVYKRRGKERLHIGERFGPSIGQVFDNEEGLSETFKRAAGAKLTKNIYSKIDWVLSKQKFSVKGL